MAKLKFKYILIDGNWVLHRNFCAMGGVSGELVDEYFVDNLVKSVTSSILNIISEFKVDKAILLWDTPPYYKNEALGDSYKGTRYKATQEAIDAEEDSNEKRKLENNRYNFFERAKAKKILQKFDILSLPSLYLDGFEGDDLAYLCSKWISENETVDKSYTGKAIIASVDSDWEYWLTEGVYLYNPKRDEVHSYEEILQINMPPKGMSLFRYKSLYDSFYGSHNDLERTILDERYDEDCHEIFKEFEREGFTTKIFKDPELAKLQLSTYDFEKYEGYSDAIELCESLPTVGKKCTNSILPLRAAKIDATINTTKFFSYLNEINQELFTD